MNLLQFLLNILWIAIGGIWMSVAWVIAGIIMALTIIGLPWTPAAFRIAVYTLLPFGSRAVSAGGIHRARGCRHRAAGPHRQHPLAGSRRLVAGAGHVLTAAIWAITIVGLPFAWAHLKLAGLALWPIGKVIVPANA